MISLCITLATWIFGRQKTFSWIQKVLRDVGRHDEANLLGHKFYRTFQEPLQEWPGGNTE